MPFDETLAARVRRALSDRADLVEKHMFGGVCFMTRGRMCCGIVQSSLMVRLAAEDADRLSEEPHVRPMDFTGRPMRGFLFVDAEGLDTPRRLRTWVSRCVAFAESQPRAKKRAGARLTRRRSRNGKGR
jgi:TfoX/Sxy family transcriptional regulator of competence genes